MTSGATLALALVLALSILAMPSVASRSAAVTAASAEPDDEIHSSFGDDATQMWLYWRGPDGTVSYGQSTSYGQAAVATNPATPPVDRTGPFWQVKITGLTAGTTYHFQIGSNGADHTFQTAPTGDFVWDDIGDTGSTYYDPSAVTACNKSWLGNVWQQVANDQPKVVTHGGDISYANECGQPSVHQFWNDIAPVATQVPIQFAWGNHEYGAPPSTAPPGTPRDSMANYKGRFHMSNAQTVPNDTTSQTSNPGCPSPGNATVNGCLGNDWGYFTAGHVLFISYPEPWYNAYPAWQQQVDPMMARAEADPNIYFIVTYGHRPAYSSQSVNSAVAALQTAVNALGDKYSRAARPDGKYVLNVGHHVHGAEVFSPIHGVVNVTDGGGGTGETTITTPSAGSVWHQDHLEHMRTTVTGATMRIDFICGPVYTPNPAKGACTKDSVIYSQTLTGYQAGPPQAKLGTTLTDATTTANVGDTLHYTATTQNTVSGTTAAGVTQSMALPSNLTILDTGGGAANGNVVTWPAADLAGGDSRSVSVTAQVASGAPGSTFTTTTTTQAADSSCANAGSVCAATDTDTVPGPPPTTTQYIANQSVETNNTGWTGLYNSVSRSSRVTNDAYDGTASLQAVRATTTQGSAGINAKPSPVGATTAGLSYAGSVWVRSQTPGQSLVLLVREVNATGGGVGSSTAKITTADTLWHRLGTTYVAKASGNTLAFSVYGTNIAANGWFHMDQMSLVSPN